MSNEQKKLLRNFDWSILLILMGLAFFSYMGISGSSPPGNLQMKQVVFYGMGFVVIFISLLIDYRWLNQLSTILYALGVIALIALLLVGQKTRNVVGWFYIGSFGIQPAEFMKLFIILSVSRWFAKQREKEVDLHAFYQLWPFFLIFGIPFLLIVVQPDLGNALVLIGIFICMMIVTGVRTRHFLYLGGFGVGGVGILTYIYFFKNELFFKIIKHHQWDRITEFMSPDVDVQRGGYQLSKSLIAIGSGTLQGKGITADTLSKSNWVPVAESDFVFSVIGETFGFIGSSILILFFFLLIYRMIRIAMDTEDPFGSYVISGIIGMFVFQIFENIGMTIGIMPITGITLPFISYGGSSLLTNMLAIGIVLNIGMRRKKLSF